MELMRFLGRLIGMRDSMGKRLLSGIKYWSQAFLFPIYWFSFFTPRSKRIWLFGSTFGKRFADNPKYFYLYLSQYQKSSVSAIWISRDRDIVKMLREHGYKACYYHSFLGIWYCLRGGVYVFDNYSKDISFWLSGGAKKINLWHGVGNKKINFDNRFDRIRHPKNNWERFKTYLRRMSDEKPHHYTLATSKTMADIFASAFRTDLKHIIIEGYPRNDILLSEDIANIYSEEELRIRAFLNQCRENGGKILFYMPTFRESEVKFFDVMELEVFSEFLKKNNYCFFAKLHPKSKLRDKFERIHLENIYNISAEVDSYSILNFTDLLITDYSSVYSDFLILNRPSALFPYDYEEYSSNTRDCYFEYDDYMKDLKAYNMKDLMMAIESALRKDTCEAGRLEVRSWMFENADGKSCERLYHRIGNILLGK
jgi:CDP-glycerol glycerophosphotransferase (TagB/SpsB family)